MDDLVQRLSQGSHRVEIKLRPEKTAAAFKECVDRGVVHVRFMDTRGGTELGVRVDRELTNLASADFEKQKGAAHLVGALMLNYVKVQCIADVDLETFTGNGRLVPMSEAASQV